MLKLKPATQLFWCVTRRSVLKLPELKVCKMAARDAPCVKHKTCPKFRQSETGGPDSPCKNTVSQTLGTSAMKSSADAVPPMQLPLQPIVPAPTKVQFYRKPLPDTCIAFSSDEGKQIFREALATEHMNCYFRLASQFRTQDEPAYCGLATLVMVLNALEIDPGRVWKGPWKWYHENMLDCCIPTELIRKQGITFDEFVCLANCNSLDTHSVRADGSASEEEFRKLVNSITTKEDTFLIVSYSRPALGQTGEGHFAAVSGYHPGRDMVLILDTARFKYPPHWISLPLLFKAMQAVDKETGLPRGYITVWPSRHSKALLLFKISDGFGVNSAPETVNNYQTFLSAWTDFLRCPNNSENGADLNAAVREAMQGLLSVALMLSVENIVLTTQQHVRCVKTAQVQCAVGDLLASLEQTPLFKAICDEIEKLDEADTAKLENIFGKWPSISPTEKIDIMKVCPKQGDSPRWSEPCDLNRCLSLSHFLTMFLLSWPYGACFTDGTVCTALLAVTQAALNRSTGQYLKEEVTTLQGQLKKLMGHHSP